MRLSRIMSYDDSAVEELFEQKTISFKKDTSWSGENSKQSFQCETDYGTEIVLFYENADLTKFRKLTINDIDESDVMECDIELYDEYRNNEEIIF
jgi:hypothetical protein